MAATTDAGTLRIEPERGRADRKAFIQVPYTLYRDNLNWVPPLRSEEAKLMDRRKNPFFQHATVEHFLARRGRRVVGRIAAIENRRHNEFQDDEIGFFGFFDVEEGDQEAATGLLHAARAWTEARGKSPMRGPVNYSTNESCGVLIDGFELRPALLMPYNRPDYAALIEGAGLVEVKKLYALTCPTSPIPERFERVVARQLKRRNIVIRPLDLAKFDREVEILHDLYNRCWERNWGFVPASDAEFEHAAGDLKMLVHTAQCAIAERDGQPVGFSVFLRDLNILLAEGPRNGKLCSWSAPFFWWKLLRGIKHIAPTRCVLLGVVPEARGMAINEAFFVHAMRHGKAAGIDETECGWVLEDNRAMISPIEAAGGRIFKTYGMYETASGHVG